MYGRIEDLGTIILQSFGRKNLLLDYGGRLGPGGSKRPPNARYRDEFSRALRLVLGSTRVSSEWVPMGGERVDILIPERSWGFEILGDADDEELVERCNRFEEGSGAYAKWIREGRLKRWLLLDFRTTMPKKYGKSIQYYALCGC